MNIIQNDERIGALLLQSGKITADEAEKILQEQETQSIRFGDAAIKLGLVDKSDIDEVLSRQFSFSYLTREDTSVDPLVVCAYTPFSKTVDRIRALRSQLSLRWFSDNKSIIFAGVESETGNSVVCANLAVSFAQLGKKTLLIDANMRSPSLHELFGVGNQTGFSDLLISRVRERVIQPLTALNNLSILPAGTTPPNPTELLGRRELGRIIDKLEESYEVIIIDVPAASEFGDFQMLLRVVKGLSIVVRKNKTSLQNIQKVKRDIAISRASLVGSVIVDF